MTNERSKMYSFRLDPVTSAELDELAELLDREYERDTGRARPWTTYRTTALTTAVNREVRRLRAELATGDSLRVDDNESRVKTGSDNQKWTCAMCRRPISWSHFKRHLNTTHREDPKPRVDAEWTTFLHATGWPERSDSSSP